MNMRSTVVVNTFQLKHSCLKTGATFFDKNFTPCYLLTVNFVSYPPLTTVNILLYNAHIASLCYLGIGVYFTTKC